MRAIQTAADPDIAVLLITEKLAAPADLIAPLAHRPAAPGGEIPDWHSAGRAL